MACHVVHVTDVAPPGLGGIETALTTLICAMPDLRATLVAPGRALESGMEWGSNVSLRPIDAGDALYDVVSSLVPHRKRKHVALAAWLVNEWCRRRVASRTRADLVHIHSFSSFRYFANFWFRHPTYVSQTLVDWLRSFEDYGHPVLFTDHSLFGGTREQFDSIRNELLVERLANVVCVERSGKANVDALAKERDLSFRTWWIPNPVDTDRFRPVPLPGNRRLIVGYAGRYEKKGTDRILQVASEAPDWVEFRLALAATEDQIGRAGSERQRSRVKILWNLPNNRMPEFYGSIHLLLDPWSWGAPRTSLEALACGRPVIRLAAEGELVREFPTDLSPIVDASDNASLFNGLARFRDTATLEGLGLACRRLAEETYSAREVVKAYREVYSAVAGSAT